MWAAGSFAFTSYAFTLEKICLPVPRWLLPRGAFPVVPELNSTVSEAFRAALLARLSNFGLCACLGCVPRLEAALQTDSAVPSPAHLDCVRG